VGHEFVRSPEEDFRRQVPAKFTAEAALDRNGLERKILQAGGHIAAATLAGHHEGLAIPDGAS